MSTSPDPDRAEARCTHPRFVVQRHRARALHYDLRLEIDGVLVSWAVPKGPTLDAEVRRLAVRVADHDLDHLGFEGRTGAATVAGVGDTIVWDTGHWSGEADPVGALARGRLHPVLHGTKLAGAFVLVRTGPPTGERERWLLWHRPDDDAVPGWDPEDHSRSVLSGLTNDEIAARDS